MRVEITYTNPWIAKRKTLRLEIHITGDDQTYPPGRRVGGEGAWVKNPVSQALSLTALYPLNYSRGEGRHGE